jgi:predicted Na+-dependent transporter
MMVLLPLLIGGAIRMFAPNAAEKIFSVVKKIGGISLVLALVFTLAIYGQDMLGTVGSFAPGAQVLFLVGITAASYSIHFGLAQPQRSAMALGMCTRNIAAVFAAYFGITNPPQGLFVMVILVIPLAAIITILAARLFARQAPIN